MVRERVLSPHTRFFDKSELWKCVLCHVRSQAPRGIGARGYVFNVVTYSSGVGTVVVVVVVIE